MASSENLRSALNAAVIKLCKNTNVTSIEIDESRSELIVSLEDLTPSNPEAIPVIPETIQGVPVVTRQAKYVVGERGLGGASLENTKRMTTLKSGASIGHYKSTAGTLGCFVVDNQNGAMMLLTNWHVAADGGSKGDPILQPGPIDGGARPGDIIARLDRSVLDHRGDAAVSTLTGARPLALNALLSGKLIMGSRRVKAADVLEKSGRSTGLTRARVRHEGVYYVDYGSAGKVGIRGFRLNPLQDGNPDNVEISKGGDSGSIWYDPTTGEAVGLHFAGESSALPSDEHAIACNIDDVLKALDVRMANSADVQSEAFAELSKLVPEFGGWAVAGLIIGAGARLIGKESLPEDHGDLVTAFRDGIVLARDHGLRVTLEDHRPEFITALAAAVGAKAAATIIGAAVGAKAVDGI